MTDSLPMDLVDAALRGTLVALLVLLAATLLRDRPQLPAARAGVAMALGLCVQVVSSTPLFEALVPRLWQAPLVALSVANAALFWIFAQALFDDEFALRRIHLGAWLAVAALGGINCAFVARSASVLAPVAMGLQRAVPLFFAILAAVAAASHWRADLVERRRRLRGFIVATGVVYTVATLLARLDSPNGRLAGMSATADVAVLLAIVAVVAWQLLRMGGSELFPAVDSRAPAPPLPPSAESRREVHTQAADIASVPPTDPVDQRLADALHQTMAVDRAYRTEDLTVAGLAARLAVPEYRLRRLINQRLGHRNFNSYVNGFRLDDACAALADPAKSELPILSIALDAGFQSIGPFNRAFKVATGLTPSDFRRGKLAES
jgi:AraC-like DNA-binding protein